MSVGQGTGVEMAVGQYDCGSDYYGSVGRSGFWGRDHCGSIGRSACWSRDGCASVGQDAWVEMTVGH